jgi:hypothetical protein
MTTKTRTRSADQPKNILIGESLMGIDLKDNNSFESTDDIYHSVGRTYRTASEAFKDADYATPIWRCETDFDRTVEILKWVMVWVFTLGFFYTFAIGFEKWIAS